MIIGSLQPDGAVEPSERPNTEVTFVTSQGCHFCNDAKHLLDALGARFPLEVTEVDLTSAEGRSIAIRWRVPFPPVILINGEYHGHGRISGRKLTKALEAITGGT
jgi:glutaredoxin